MPQSIAHFKKYLIYLTIAGLSIVGTVANADTYKITGSKETGYNIPYPTVDYQSGEPVDLIKKGEYLSKAGDCIACHTDTNNNGKPFAGGLAITIPFGSFYTPNITADKATGIGNWSDKDFIDAMRQGHAPDGSNYFPVFPYPNFNKLNDDDLKAIKAYLFSIPEENRKNTPNDVLFPFNIRFLQYGWKILFFYPYSGQYKQDSKQTAEWNRGAYLVEGLGHCGMCHTPHNPLGGEKRDYALTGEFVDGYYAPNISASGLKDISIDEIVAVFKDYKMFKGAGKVEGPMADVNNNSLRYLSNADLRAIAVYLKTVQSKVPPVKKAGAITADTGREIYDGKCAVCHNSGAAGAPKIGDTTDWDDRTKQQGMALVMQRAINGYNSMPPKGACMDCSDDEVKAAVHYLIDQSKPGNPYAAKAQPPKMPALTMADGQRVYEKACSVCHAQGKLGAPQFGDQAAWSLYLKDDMETIISRAITGYKGMPPKGACYTCTNGEVQAATIYMLQNSQSGHDYSLWLGN